MSDETAKPHRPFEFRLPPKTRVKGFGSWRPDYEIIESEDYVTDHPPAVCESENEVEG